MAIDKSPNTVIVGLAFFSMFFGSGNLIFPLMLGAKYENYFLIATLGFAITAVLLPTFGILAMLPAHGRYEKLFSGLLPAHISRWFFLIILLFWIPFGSGPRCVVLAHASISTYLPIDCPIWLFSFIFLGLVYFSAINKSRVIDILGKYLTPALLLSILCIVLSSLINGEINILHVDPKSVFLESLVDGYYTQDLIAAVFFSSTLISVLKLTSENQSLVLKKTWYGGLIAVFLLIILYAALMAASAVHSELLRGLSGEELISILAKIALGDTFGGISSIAVSLACLTTEIALVLVFADFLNHNVFHGKKNKQALVLSLLIIWIMSQFKFAGIMAIIAPAMQVIYPVLFFVVIRFLWLSRLLPIFFKRIDK